MPWAVCRISQDSHGQGVRSDFSSFSPRGPPQTIRSYNNALSDLDGHEVGLAQGLHHPHADHDNSGSAPVTLVPTLTRLACMPSSDVSTTGPGPHLPGGTA